MSEQLVSKEQLDSYLSSIDMNNTQNKRVLGRIQILDTSLISQLMYYLVNGKISFNSLYSDPISNLSIRVLLDAIQQSTDTQLDKFIFYKNTIKTFPSYIQYMKDNVANSVYRLNKKVIPAISLSSPVVIDGLGLISGAYNSISEVRDKYINLFSTADALVLQAEINTSIATLSGLGIDVSTVYNFINTELQDDFFIYATSGEILLQTSPTHLLGWITRQSFVDVEYIDFQNSINTILQEMSIDYTLDIPKNGSYTIQRLMNNTFNSYSSLFSSINKNASYQFINKYIYLVALRKVFYTNIYGSTFFDNTSVTNEITKFNAIQDFFTKIYNLTLYIRNQCATF